MKARKDTLKAWRLRCRMTGRSLLVNLRYDIPGFDMKPIVFQQVFSQRVWWPQVCEEAIPVRVFLGSFGEEESEEGPRTLSGYLFLGKNGRLYIRPKARGSRGRKRLNYCDIVRFETADPDQGGPLWDNRDPFRDLSGLF